MICEFIGLPGSGKSTIQTAASRMLEHQGIAYDTIRMLSKRVIAEDRAKIGFLRRRDHRASLYGALAFGEAQPEVFDALFINARSDMSTMLWNMEMLAQLYFAGRRDPGDTVTFMDEGFVHRGAATFLLSRNEVGFQDYMSRVPLAHVVIHVTTPLEVANERIGGRKVKKRVPAGWVGATEAETQANLAHFQHLSQLACEVLRKRVGQVIEIDGTLVVEDSAAQLVRKLIALQATRAGTG